MKQNEMCSVMFSEYPDIVDVVQMQKMLGISRHLAYELIRIVVITILSSILCRLLTQEVQAKHAQYYEMRSLPDRLCRNMSCRSSKIRKANRPVYCI